MTTVPTNSTGYAVLSYSFASKGFYNVTFVSATTSVYNSATSYNPLNVYLKTTLTIQAGIVIVDQQNSITVTLKDQNGNVLASRTLSISINGASFANVTTGSNGQASFNWSPSNTGNYTLAASYSATGSSDTGYEPASASVVVNVKPQMIINTQTTGSGTQSVTFNTAQGQPGTGSGPSLQILFPSIGQIVIKLNGQQVGSASLSNKFGWSCVARVFGACVLTLPYWQVSVSAVENGLLSFNCGVNTLGSTSLRFDPPNLLPSDDLAFETGMLASSAMIGVVDTMMGASGFNYNVIAAFVATTLMISSSIVPVAGWAGYSNGPSRASYEEGVLDAIPLGLPEVLVEGLPSGTPVEGAAALAYGFFWASMLVSWFPPLGSPLATATMLLGLALFILVTGAVLSAALS
jgi:hypothetical protein